MVLPVQSHTSGYDNQQIADKELAIGRFSLSGAQAELFSGWQAVFLAPDGKPSLARKAKEEEHPELCCQLQRDQEGIFKRPNA